jgi:hypothetical protein
LYYQRTLAAPQPGLPEGLENRINNQSNKNRLSGGFCF